MVKKALITSGITIVFALAVFMVYSTLEQQTAKKLVQTKIQSTPVNVNLFTLDSTRFIFPLAKPVVFILYNSTCEHCQYELSQINAEINSFNNPDQVGTLILLIFLFSGLKLQFLQLPLKNIFKSKLYLYIVTPSCM